MEFGSAEGGEGAGGLNIGASLTLLLILLIELQVKENYRIQINCTWLRRLLVFVLPIFFFPDFFRGFLSFFFVHSSALHVFYGTKNVLFFCVMNQSCTLWRLVYPLVSLFSSFFPFSSSFVRQSCPPCGHNHRLLYVLTRREKSAAKGQPESKPKSKQNTAQRQVSYDAFCN